MKKAKKNQIKRIKGLLEIVRVYIEENKLIEAKWLSNKIENFVNRIGIVELKLNISLLRARIRSKQYENKILESKDLFIAGII